MKKQTLLATAIMLATVLTIFAGARRGSYGMAVLKLMPHAASFGLDDTSAAARDEFIPARSAARAPALAAGTWINSAPLTLDSLRGRVVLVEFWTFGCYNCRNTLPSVKGWDARYRDKGLTIIGVHTPESGGEKNLAAVRERVRALGIRYPVVTDNEFETWRAYGVEAWPTIVVLDKQGRIRWTHIGEGRYDETESVIQKLLAEGDKTAANSDASAESQAGLQVVKTNDE